MLTEEHALNVDWMRAFVGAINTFLKSDNVFTSVSAFSPICNPVECDWGKKVSQPAVLQSARSASVSLHCLSCKCGSAEEKGAECTPVPQHADGVHSLNRTHSVIQPQHLLIHMPREHPMPLLCRRSRVTLETTNQSGQSGTLRCSSKHLVTTSQSSSSHKAPPMISYLTVSKECLFSQPEHAHKYHLPTRSVLHTPHTHTRTHTHTPFHSGVCTHFILLTHTHTH